MLNDISYRASTLSSLLSNVHDFLDGTMKHLRLSKDTLLGIGVKQEDIKGIMGDAEVMEFDLGSDKELVVFHRVADQLLKVADTVVRVSAEITDLVEEISTDTPTLNKFRDGTKHDTEKGYLGKGAANKLDQLLSINLDEVDLVPEVQNPIYKLLMTCTNIVVSLIDELKSFIQGAIEYFKGHTSDIIREGVDKGLYIHNVI
ncbi:hypothetical protein Cyrtocomes_00929 [Candidatus Cyrtobacter comes]|uniref:Uncharacterized protein n=1 Tax=Candidatus Cyrtobacter comes TaxID=675776 RepID=A0ABU5L8U3_9RICK|nr:hypothetical protein [Candidatus Cyrtobacter comes]MDZ5762542.1 hypothetical protein [Candidatus Cyrtobacter comes]